MGGDVNDGPHPRIGYKRQRREGNKRASLGLFFFLAELNESGFRVFDVSQVDFFVEITL